MSRFAYNTVYRPDGPPFRTPLEVRREMERAPAERDQAEAARAQAQAERDRLAAKLRALGVDPDTL